MYFNPWLVFTMFIESPITAFDGDALSIAKLPYFFIEGEGSSLFRQSLPSLYKPCFRLDSCPRGVTAGISHSRSMPQLDAIFTCGHNILL